MRCDRRWATPGDGFVAMTNPPPTTPPTPPPAAPPGKGGVTSLPRDLSDFLVELSITLNKHTIYPAGHPLLGVAIEGVANRLELLFIGARDSLSIGVARKQLIMEGVATDPQNPVLKELAERLHRHHVGALKFQRGVTRQELADSLSALAVDATRSEKPIGLDREALIDRWQHVHFFPLSYDRLQLIEEDATGEPTGPAAPGSMVPAQASPMLSLSASAWQSLASGSIGSPRANGSRPSP